MKKAPFIGFISLSLVASNLLLQAADTVRYDAEAVNTSVSIQGTSTAHEWEMKGALIAGSFEAPAAVSFDPAQTTIPGLNNGVLVANVKATIRVNSVHSTAAHLPGTMDGLMQDALKSKDFPKIEYHLTELKLKESHTAGQPFEFDAKGDLAIAGVTNKVTFPVTIGAPDKQTLKISGQTKLKMTDYKVDPPAPTIGLGLLKCGDEVTITFEWTVAKPH